MHQPAALQVLLKLFREVGRKVPALTGQLSLELGPVLMDYLVM